MKIHKKFSRVLLVLNIILLTSACNKKEQLTGMLIDLNNQPIKNAIVEIVDENQKTKSTANGSFALPIKNLKDTTYITLKVSAKNYLDKLITINKQFAAGEIVLTRKSELAHKIINDEKLAIVKSMALKLLSSSNVTAGGGYPEIWIRDLNTFVVAFLRAGDPENQRSTIKKTLLHFFAGQDQNYYADDGLPEESEGSIADQYNGDVYKKISVETDQETSLILALDKYIHITGDKEILFEIVNGQTVLQRVEKALAFLYRDRWTDEFGLIFGAVTVDWGDISPDVNKGIGANLRPDSSHITADVYDNAMLSLAISKFLSFLGEKAPKKDEWETKLNELNKSILNHLWDSENMKFYPHLYPEKTEPYASGTPWEKMQVDTFIDGRPFDENKIYFHGGTGVAIKAGLLNEKQIAWSLKKMRENVKKSNAMSIGLTVYPPYPQNIWTSEYTKSRIGSLPYFYQNGGDWTWFGARIVNGLAESGFIEEAYTEIQPMLERVIKHEGFYEWWHPKNQGGNPIGHGDFRGSAGVLFSAIETLEKWANDNK